MYGTPTWLAHHYRPDSAPRGCSVRPQFRAEQSIPTICHLLPLVVLLPDLDVQPLDFLVERRERDAESMAGIAGTRPTMWSGSKSMPTSASAESTTARSMTFSSSRTLPGHG